MGKYRLTPEQVEKISEILAKGDRIELIPAKEKVKIVQEVRKEIIKLADKRFSIRAERCYLWIVPLFLYQNKWR